MVGANEAFAESLSYQLMEEAGIETGIKGNIVASAYDTMRETIHINQNTPFEQPLELACLYRFSKSTCLIAIKAFKTLSPTPGTSTCIRYNPPEIGILT